VDGVAGGVLHGLHLVDVGQPQQLVQQGAAEVIALEQHPGRQGVHGPRLAHRHLPAAGLAGHEGGQAGQALAADHRGLDGPAVGEAHQIGQLGVGGEVNLGDV